MPFKTHPLVFSNLNGEKFRPFTERDARERGCVLEGHVAQTNSFCMALVERGKKFEVRWHKGNYYLVKSMD